MNLWQTFKLDKNTSVTNKSFSMHFEKGVDPELRKLFLSFASWLRKNYVFPVHINIYLKNCEKLRLLNGKMAYGSFRYFEDKPPYIRIPIKIESEILQTYSIDEAYEQVLSSLVHELTHYYQWILNLEQSNATSERQANYYRYRIIEEYYKCTSI